MSNKDVKQNALDNLADALTEDILNTPDDELLREVEEDYGDPRALANKFDQILERAEKQVFGTTPSAASAQVRSSFIDLPVRWVKGMFDLGSRLSELLSSLRPRTLAWSATAATVVILVQAAVITAVVVKEQGAPSGPDVAVQMQRAQEWVRIKPSDKEIAALVAAGRQLIVSGDIPNARLVLQQVADGNAAAALELGATYDPIELKKLGVLLESRVPGPDIRGVSAREERPGVAPDIPKARAWYQKAKKLGSTEAAARLESLAGRESQSR